MNVYIDNTQEQRAKSRSVTKKVTLAALLFGVVGLAALSSMEFSSKKTELFMETANPEEQEAMKAYINFIAEYGKQYASKDHAFQNYNVFKKNYEAIKEHNKHEKVLPFVMGVNQFADMSAEDFQKLNGVEIPKVLLEITSRSHVIEPK